MTREDRPRPGPWIAASDFASTPVRRFPAWVRAASYVPLYGIGVPLVRLLEARGRWPDKRQAEKLRKSRGNFGDYRPDAGDVFICAYFKSGTNLLMQTAVQIAFHGQAEFDHIHCVVPWPDAPDVFGRPIVPLDHPGPRERSLANLRAIKTHLDLARVPFSPEARYIAIARDPKDVCVSGYLFIKSLALGPLMPSVESWVNNFLSPDFAHGNWAEHLNSYWQVRHHPNVLFLTYEEMLRDQREATGRIAQLMGVVLNPQELESVLRQASFAEMKRIASKFEAPPATPWCRRGPMVRRGGSGHSHELLTPGQERRIDDHWRAELIRLGCDFPYDDAFAMAH